MTSEVFFTDLHAGRDNNLLDKMDRLFEVAGFSRLIQEGDLLAIKVHFGEQGNLAYVRPQFARRLVDKARSLGAKPFLTDANTLYVGSRANAVDHLETAIKNGFAYAVVGAPLIIADGLTGKDYMEISIDGQHFEKVKIGRAAYFADSLLAITHFKGHQVTGFGGTIKNLSMGLGSRSGKQQMHSDLRPKVDPAACRGCRQCLPWCPAEAIVFDGVAFINDERCIGCGECTASCNEKAIAINWRTDPAVIQEKMAEYTLGVLKNKQEKAGFFNFILDVSPDCDCFPWNDMPIIPNIGILASEDPVALDQASLDLVNRAPSLRQDGRGNQGENKFKVLHGVDGTAQLAHGEKIGLGTRQYRLIEI